MTNDLISRKAAIDALKRISFSHWFECGEYLSEDTREIEIINSKKALEVIEALPSEQPEIIHCRECKWHRFDKDNIPYCYNIDYGYGWKDDDFCSRAERREDDHETD